MKIMAKSISINSVDKDLLYSERNEWKDILTRMREENVQLKNQLSALLKTNQSLISLQKAEEFQSRFIWEDEQILFLRAIVKLLDTMYAGDSNDPAGIKDLYPWIESTRKRINVAQTQFELLKNDFNQIAPGFPQ